MSDDARLRALISDSLRNEREHPADPTSTGWNSADIAAMLDPANPEVARIINGDAPDPDVARLAKIAAEVAPRR